MKREQQSNRVAIKANENDLIEYVQLLTVEPDFKKLSMW